MILQIAAAVALLLMVGTWVWAINIPNCRQQKAVDWLNRDLLGMPEWAHRLGITPAIYREQIRPAYRGLGKYLDDLDVRYPYTLAGDIEDWDGDEEDWARNIEPRLARKH